MTENQGHGVDIATLEQWLYMLHGDCPGWSVVSSNLNWAGRAFEITSDGWPDELVRYVTQLDRQGAKGIYLRVTTVGSEPESKKRGRDEDSVALPALWLDMDIAGPGHKPLKALPGRPAPLPLPPDEITCRKIVEHSDLPEPTLWIHSGGGLYPYWFFKTPVILNTPEDIDHWTDVSQNLHDRIAAAAADLGYHYGLGTHDMSRVLRLPGTVNRKIDDAPVPARMYDEFTTAGITYHHNELETPLADTTPHHQEPVVVQVPRQPSVPVGPSQGVLPGQDYDQRGDVLQDVLFPEGWETHSLDRGELLLTRPGKDRRDGHSASWGYKGSRNLYVWSSDAGLPVMEPLSPFYLYAHYNHGGDFKAAAKDLAQQGYGDPLPDRPAQLQPSTPQALPVQSPAEPPTVSPSPPPPSSPIDEVGVGGDDVQFIDVTDDTECTNTLISMLGTGRMHNLYQMHGKLVYVSSGGPGERKVESGDGIHALNAYGFKAYLGSLYPPYRRGKEGEWKRGVYSVTLANTVYNGVAKATNLRTLKGVSRLPIPRPDGTIWDTPGYDTQTQYIYMPDPTLHLPTIPTCPTKEEIAKAKGIINLAIGDFPWVSENHKNNFLGFMLTPLLTRVVATPFKLAVIGARQAGSGKTLLAELLNIIHGGTLMPPMSGGEDEIRKVITSNLLDTDQIVSFWDNQVGELRSPALDALITSRTWKDRILGRTGTQEFANDRLWGVTGNNLHLGTDLNRRAVWCVIDPEMPKPENRNNFRIPDLMSWANTNRGQLLWALYTLIQAWVQDGRKTRCDKSDVFCGWVGTINGIIDATGWGGSFDVDESRQQEESSQEESWTDLFEAIEARFGEEEWTINQVLSLINPQHSDMAASLMNIHKPWSMDLLPVDMVRDFQQGNTAVVARTLGIRLKGIEGSFVGGLRVKQNRQRTRHGFRWHLVRYIPPMPAAQLPADHASPIPAVPQPTVVPDELGLHAPAGQLVDETVPQHDVDALEHSSVPAPRVVAHTPEEGSLSEVDHLDEVTRSGPDGSPDLPTGFPPFAREDLGKIHVDPRAGFDPSP